MLVVDSINELSEYFHPVARTFMRYCKLSGLVTEAGHNPDFDCLIPYMQHLLTTFTASRLMWGSDWPVLNLATDYSQWISLTEAFLCSICSVQQTQIWSKTAINFYQLST